MHERPLPCDSGSWSTCGNAAVCAGSIEFALGLNNTLGYAEDISVSAEMGMNNSTVLAQPCPGSSDAFSQFLSWESL